jgi:cysteine desulfurase / selenocysteine lyase
MTTPTTTADGQNPLAGWLPDEAALTRLANELFNALPGQPPAGWAADPIGAIGAAAGSPAALSVAGPVNGPVHGAAGPIAGSIPGPAADPTEPGTFELPGTGLPELGQAATPSFYFVDEAAPFAGRALGPAFDVEAVRRDFPILDERINGRRLVWLDNAATTQKPQAVIDRLTYFYQHENSNIHRAAHTLAARATDAYEEARSRVAAFIGAPSGDSVVFTRGATEAINLVARSWGGKHVGAGDEIILSQLEHHANIVPWQQLAADTGAKLRIIPVDDDGQLLLDAYERLLSDRTRLVAVAQVSNALGTIVPIDRIIAAAHRVGAKVLIDGAQAIAHIPVDLKALDADFYVFSGHKVFAPTGIGALYGTPEVLESMPPWQGGGNMIQDVTFEHTTYQRPPARFEAGTGNIADAIGLGAALDYLGRIGLPGIAQYEHDLLDHATGRLLEVPGLRLIGTAPEKTSVLSFMLDGWQPEDVGSALDQEGIAVRAGHHCAQPILRRYGLEATVRAALAMYNTRDEVDLLAEALHGLAARTGRGGRNGRGRPGQSPASAPGGGGQNPIRYSSAFTNGWNG